jgi:hypothetical protein
MPHLKCDTCRARFHIDERHLSDVRDERCPGCSSPLEAPAELAELVGFRRARLDALLPDESSDFLTAVAMALTPPGTER